MPANPFEYASKTMARALALTKARAAARERFKDHPTPANPWKTVRRWRAQERTARNKELTRAYFRRLNREGIALDLSIESIERKCADLGRELMALVRARA